MSESEVSGALTQKEEGNQLFKSGNYEGALVCYTKSLKLFNEEGDKNLSKEKGNVYKNRAACYLKLEKFKQAEDDCSQALELIPNDAKALFRRSQALEKLGKFEEAFTEARKVAVLEPKNKLVHDLMRRVGSILQEKANKAKTTDGLVDEMFSALTDPSTDQEKREKAMKNLVILANQEAGAKRIIQAGGILKLLAMIETGPEEMRVLALKVLRGLCLGQKARALLIMQGFSDEKLLSLVMSSNPDVVVATVGIIQQILETILPEDDPKYKILKAKAAEIENREEVKKLLSGLIYVLTNQQASAETRETIIEALLKTVPKSSEAVKLFFELKGFKALILVAVSTSPVHPPDSIRVPVSAPLRSHISVLFSKLFEAFGHQEKDKKLPKEHCQDVIRMYISKGDLESQIEGLTALSVLMQGVVDVGAPLVVEETVLVKVVALAELDNLHAQVIAGEVLALGAADKERCSVLKATALPVLKALYQSKDKQVCIRGLVGLCKVGGTMEGNVNARVFSEEATAKLHTALRNFLVKNKSLDIRKWAVEGLSFLSMDADVKEELIKDDDELKALLELSRVEDHTVQYGVAQTLVNITNSYDMPERTEETEQLEKLQEFAKMNIPKFSEKDTGEAVKNRIAKLVKEKVVNALVHLSKTESHTSREMLARVFRAISGEQEHRGLMVQQGGAKSLLSLAHENTDKGKDLASQALARIAITMNPAVAFPGQRVYELVRPLIRLLGFSKNGLEKFESLMALTNLAQMNDEVRSLIMKEKGFSNVEYLMFDEDEMLKRASTECMCNLVNNQEAFEKFEMDVATERVKLLTLYCGFEDFKLARAASGALAILSSSEKVCKKIVEQTSSWLEILTSIVVSDEPELQLRAVFIIANMIAADKDIASQIVESKIFEVLVVLLKDEVVKTPAIKEQAERALKGAQDHGLIRPNQ